MSSNELAVFYEEEATLANLKAANENLVFDYASPEGGKAARSHIATLRKGKTRVSNIHQAAKADALVVCRLLDDKKRELIGEIDGMIAVHKEPLDAIEAEKQVAIDAEKKQLEEIEAKRQADLEAREVAVKEAEDKIAREKADAERVARDNEIRERAAEAARVEAEQKAKDEAAAKEIAEKNRLNAEKCKEQRRIENKKHRKKIEDEAHAGLTKTGHLGNVEASAVLGAIMGNRIPHVSINY